MEQEVDFTVLLKEKLEEWSDEQCLMAFGGFLKRVSIATKLVGEDDDVFTHQVIYLVCGDKVVSSDPQELDWPVSFIPGLTKEQGVTTH